MGNQEDRKFTLPDLSDDKVWLTTAIALAFLFVIAGLACTVYVEFYQKPPDALETTKLIGSGILALTTFATVIWRGLISDRQTKEQKRQNDANEDAAYVSLLERGAKALGEKEKLQDRQIGVYLLSACIRDQKPGRFQSQAMDVLADYYQSNFINIRQDDTVALVSRAMRDAFRESGVASSRLGTFDFPAKFELWAKRNQNTDIENRPSKSWEPVYGFRAPHFIGGEMPRRSLALTLANLPSNTKLLPQTGYVTLTKVQVLGAEIPDNVNLQECILEECSFSVQQVFDHNRIQGNRYQRCNFSNVIFRGSEWEKLFFMRKPATDAAPIQPSDMNYFIQGREPVFQRAVGIYDDDEIAYAVEPVNWEEFFDIRPDRTLLKF